MNDQVVNFIFVTATGLIAWHGLTYRDKKGDRPFVHLLFGAIALLYCLWVLTHDILKLF